LIGLLVFSSSLVGRGDVLDRHAAIGVVLHAHGRRAARFQGLVDARDRCVAGARREVLAGRLGREHLAVDGGRLGRGLVRERLELGLGLVDELVRILVVHRPVERELLVGGHAAVLGSRKRRIGTALAVREDRGAAAGGVALVAGLAAAVGRVG